MTSKRIIVGIGAPARALARRLMLAWILALLPWSASRADVALYQAVVPLKGTDAGDRAAAFGEALQTAAVRASGRRDAANAPRIVAAASDPMRFVQQYSTTADHQLKVGFDARAMEDLLQQAGLPWWPAERPAVTVLLFPAGAVQAVTAADAVPERAVLEQTAQARGVPLGWPVQIVDPGTARARLAGAGATLVGVASGAGYQWSFGHAGQVVTAQGMPGDAIDLVADTLAERYAPASTRSQATVSVRIGGLADLSAYSSLMKYLEDLSLVRSLAVKELAGDTIVFELGIRGDLNLLRRIIALDARLVPAGHTGEVTATTEGAPDFLWQP
jgi:uncharacterized protein